MKAVGNPSKILVTTDFSAEALNGVDYAAWLADRLDCEVTLLYVVEDHLPPIVPGMSEEERSKALEDQAKRASRKLSGYADTHLPRRRVKTEVLTGSPAKEIVRFAEEHDTDLLVMASRGYGLVGQLLIGSTTERVLHRARCPVLVVPTELS